MQQTCCRFNFHIFVVCLSYLGQNMKIYDFVCLEWEREQRTDGQCTPPRRRTAHGCACKYPSKNRNFKRLLGFCVSAKSQQIWPFPWSDFWPADLKRNEDHILSALQNKRILISESHFKIHAENSNYFWEFVQLFLDTEEVAAARTLGNTELHIQLLFLWGESVGPLFSALFPLQAKKIKNFIFCPEIRQKHAKNIAIEPATSALHWQWFV